jgi:hypothetical protein
MSDSGQYTDAAGVTWVQQGSVLAAVDRSIKAAGAALGEKDAGAVAALRVLARNIDMASGHDASVGEDGELVEERRPRGFDNVTLPTFLKYLDALGLTPAGRKGIEGDSKPKTGRPPRLASVANLMPPKVG